MHIKRNSILYSEIINFHVSGSSITSIKAQVSNWKIYPNPTTEILKIENSDARISNNDIYLTITDLQGKAVLTKHLSDLYSGVDISNLKKGCYLIRLSNYNKIFYRQALIK